MPKNNFAALAFDRGTVRSRDEDGRLYVAMANISKSNICGYYGSEIPNCAALGLNQNELYQLLRDPEELEKAASTFNNLPLLSRHALATADDPMPELVIGSTGTDAVFDAPYLKNSLSIWNAIAIAGIETGAQKEISCGYRYDADMRPGTYEGIKYDGRMINIRGSHVAIVEVGRAGPDVLIGDAKNPLITTEYSNMKASRKAIAVKAALGAYLRPMLAQDQAIGDIGALVRGVSTATIAQDSARIVKAVQSHVNGKLAADKAVDADELAKVIKLAADAEPDDDKKDKPAEDDEDEQREGESDDDFAKRKKAKSEPAKDAEEDDKKEDKKAAMDSATVRTMIADAVAATKADGAALYNARALVRPICGEVALDSAEEVHAFALKQLGVDTAGVHASAYPAMIKMAQDRKPAAVVALDSASVNLTAKLIPGLDRFNK